MWIDTDRQIDRQRGEVHCCAARVAVGHKHEVSPDHDHGSDALDRGLVHEVGQMERIGCTVESGRRRRLAGGSEATANKSPHWRQDE